MSLEFTTAYASFESKLAALFPSHGRLVDCHQIEKNPDGLLRLGWGLTFNRGGVNTARTIGPTRTTKINFQVLLTRQSYAMQLDPAGKATAEKALLEDLRAIIDSTWSENLGVTTTLPKVDFEDFDGVLTVRTEKSSYVYLIVNISVEFFIT